MSSEPGWQAVRRVRTHEQVLAQIQQKILAGRLRVGERLPSERELVQALGVSRASVREALRVLEALGIVDAHVGSGQDAGSVVAGRSTAALTSLLRLHMALSQFALSDLVDTRVQLERAAASAAAARAGPEDLARLRRLSGEMARPGVAPERFHELDSEFHLGIAAASANALAADLMQALRDAVRDEMLAAFGRARDWPAMAAALAAEHAGILDAIEAGDGPRAADLVAGHITAFYRDHG